MEQFGFAAIIKTLQSRFFNFGISFIAQNGFADALTDQGTTTIFILLGHVVLQEGHVKVLNKEQHDGNGHAYEQQEES